MLHKKVVNLLILNQSILDFMLCMMVVLLQYSNDITKASEGKSRELYCKFWSSEYMMWVLIDNSTYNLLVMTFERNFAIKNPLKYDEAKVRRRLPFSICFTWLIGFVIPISFPLFTTVLDGECVVDALLHTQFQRNIALSFNVLFEMLLPLSLMVFLYGHLAYILRVKQTRSDLGSGGRTMNYLAKSN